MSNIFIRILRPTLKKLAQLTIWRYRPGVIGLTGSAGKTSTKLAVKAVLGHTRRVRASSGNLNNDLGLPLAVLGDWTQEELKLVSRDTPAHTARLQKLIFWLKVIFVSLSRIAFRSADYPEIIILEYGADRPGDIKYLLTVARPNVSVITAIGNLPVHVEFYKGPEEVAREKGRLIEYLPAGGCAILNIDDPRVRALASRTRARVVTYGFEKGSEVRLSRFENKISAKSPPGISFVLGYAGQSASIRMEGIFGRAHAYAAAGAAAVGIAFGMGLDDIAQALGQYSPAESRMKILSGIQSTTIIDDSYNASPIAVRLALDALRDIRTAHSSAPARRAHAVRKIAVLGDMLELGKFAAEAHEEIGRHAAEAADVLFTVGQEARRIAEAAQKAGMKKMDIYSFQNAKEAARKLQEFIRAGDVVLVKGSHAMELDTVVEQVRERPLHHSPSDSRQSAL